MKTESAPATPNVSPRPEAPQTAPSQTQVQPVARAAQNKRFADQVARADSRTGGGTRPGPGIKPERGTALRCERPAAPAPHPGKMQAKFMEAERRDEDPSAVIAGATSPGERSPAAGSARVEAAGIVDDQTQIERMAAAIAEVAAKGAEARYLVAFPPGMSATGAVIARDAAGALVLRIVGVDDRLSARQSDRLRGELADALGRRKLRVSRLDFDKRATGVGAARG